MADEMTVSMLVNRLMAIEQEYGDLPVKVEVWNAPAEKADVPVFSVMESPLVEGVDDDGVMFDSYGKPIPMGPDYIVLTLEDQFELIDPVNETLVEEARGWFAKIIDDGCVQDSEWLEIQDLYERMTELVSEPDVNAE